MPKNALPATADKSSEFLYAIENPNTASSIEAFQIDTNTGALTALSLATNLSRHANDMVIDRKSKFLFAGESSNCCFQGPPPSVQSFAIDASGACCALVEPLKALKEFGQVAPLHSIAHPGCP